MSSKFGAHNATFTGRKSNHHGVDIASPMGSPILSMDDGVITYAGKKTCYGILVEVNHEYDMPPAMPMPAPPRLRLETCFSWRYDRQGRYLWLLPPVRIFTLKYYEVEQKWIQLGICCGALEQRPLNRIQNNVLPKSILVL